MATCPNGHDNPVGLKFCGECGAQLVAEKAGEPSASETSELEAKPLGGLSPRVIAIGGGIVVLVVILVIVLGGGGGGQTVKGTFTLFDADTASSGCFGTGGYDDIGPGTQVRVTDEDGTLLASSDLSSGKEVEDFGCIYRFTINDLPDAKFYRFEVSHRGELSYSRKQLEKNKWRVDLSLGDITDDF